MLKLKHISQKVAVGLLGAVLLLWICLIGSCAYGILKALDNIKW